MDDRCGFCTPGIVMSLYAMMRNAWNPESKAFHLSASTIELEGHLDGNLCRCTGYKPILEAAKSFILEDVKQTIISEETNKSSSELSDDDQAPTRGELTKIIGTAPASCGRPGGCCRDKVEGTSPAQPQSDATSETSHSDSSCDATSTQNSGGSSDDLTQSDRDDKTTKASYGAPVKKRDRDPPPGEEGEGFKSATDVEAKPVVSGNADKTVKPFKKYLPASELLFPAALRRFKEEPICYGTSDKIWLRPTSLAQLLKLKSLEPSAKLVGGSSEVQVEIRFKNSQFAVIVYVAEIPELIHVGLPSSEHEISAMTELEFGANVTLTQLEHLCKILYEKLGQRGLVLEACRKQLRYFAGRQIRNAASLAGNLATASPISDMNPVLMAAGATIIAHSDQRQELTLPMDKFFLSYRKTSLPAEAVIGRIRIPIPPTGVSEVFKAYKQAKRKDDDIAIVTAAFRVRLSVDGKIEQISLAYGGMAPTSILAGKTQTQLHGMPWYDAQTLDTGLRSLREELHLDYGVPGGMATYRVTLALSFFFRFWHEVVAELKLGAVDVDLVAEIHRGISSGSRDNYNPHEQRVVGKQIPHLSSVKQTTGEAEYVDDMPRQDRELHTAFVFSQRAHAKLVKIDWSPAIGPGLALGYVDKNDLTEEQNLWGSIKKDEPIFADGLVESHGQVIGMVYAETALEARKAARLVNVVYADLPTILTIDEAIEAKSFFPYGKELKKGAALHSNMAAAFDRCDKILSGTIRMGGQEHFYLETNAALAVPHSEDGTIDIWSSTQNTMETQEFVSHVLGVPSNRVNARVKRLGGGFGGKESRSVPIACAVALAAKKEKRPMRCMLDRDEDMMTSGQRHPFQARFKMGVMKDGTLVALDIDIYDNAGFSCDMSTAVMDRCCTHVDNCYEIPNVHIRGHVCKTNTHSNTAFRGFGGPQGMFITETIMSAVAEGLDIPIDSLRLHNLYKNNDHTPFLQKIDEDWHIPQLLSELRDECKYDLRRSDIQKFNQANRWKKRGISMIPAKFGISFATAIHLNQASAAVKIFADGSVLLHHGGVEMGQGLYTKMCQVAAQELGVPIDAVYTSDTSSYYTANVSPTAASSGSDLNGMAVKDACDQLNMRLKPYWEKFGADADMKTIAHAAYLDRVNLSASGFWKMPKVGYKWGNFDFDTVNPMYYYFTQGVACSEVEVDLLTGDHTVLRTDIKMDVGRSINPAIDYGQIEGAFVQGQGLFTMEESLWTRSGQLFTRGPGTYKIPGFSDIPQEFNVSFLQGVSWRHLRSIQSSKGVGEPPLFLGAAVLFALRDALLSARKDNDVKEHLTFDSPATAERIRLAAGDSILEMSRVAPKAGEKTFFVAVA
ncbi:hypothetical protein LTR84_007381 [Exophiala bonariae]|uniref:xanthine dehydrogenase n=1 Tax=Exophiala bonariae TaxID=1690606 RepID=A0AAV9MYC5_9EURO|nr:hypothetical protein LTR84_007381 [Exophiala bonariae]